MTNVDLFDDLAVEAGDGAGQAGVEPVQAEMAIPPAGTVVRRLRRLGAPDNASEDPHFRLAMRAARRLPRSDRRDQTRRLICHHLRCMLEDPAPAHGARR
ncbi:MAG: hypothetical protein V2J24_22245 [Pseudomonadales bacterium]|nr:hypothetical protein [Pseudomonadales bacterium]